MSFPEIYNDYQKKLFNTIKSQAQRLENSGTKVICLVVPEDEPTFVYIEVAEEEITKDMLKVIDEFNKTFDALNLGIVPASMNIKGNRFEI